MRSTFQFVIPWCFHGCLMVMLALGSPAVIHAQTGVSEDRVSLPDGPGSMGGLGENASLGSNNGQYEHTLALDMPMGHPGAVPSLALKYSSGAGNGLVGMGWTLAWPTLERMTSKGLPRYSLADRFAADGGTELVLIPGTNPPTYRARMEGGFVRYTWVGAGTTGTEGHWKAEMPDGSVNHYGADAAGTLSANAREGTAAGTFRYHLVETVTVDGHRVRYAYTRTGNTSLLAEVTWLFDGSGVPRNRVTLAYEPRPDTMTDCKPGFCWRLQQRIRTITTAVGGQQLHRHQLTYEDPALSGGATRLSRVEQFAPDGTRFPLVYALSYSRALGGVCTEATCGQPFVRSMGSLGVNLQSGSATLVDINGDSFPDVVETPSSGNHRFFVSQLAADGNHTYLPAAPSAHGTSSIRLGTPSVQMMDVNGDGFADLANAKVGNVLINGGTGDWVPMGTLGVANLPDMDADAMDGNGVSIKFMDYDNDKLVDVIRSEGTTLQNGSTTVWRNTGTDFVADSSVEVIGAGFGESNLQLTDINGDNLLDAVLLTAGGLRYRLSLGYGRWEGTQFTIVDGLPIEASELSVAELEDLNGDGLTDVVVVSGNQVKYAINRNGREFESASVVTTVAGGTIPERNSNTTVLYADMNGNGSSDIVWVDQNGNVTYLELFPIRPNLLARIENGLGALITITYASAVQHQARDVAAGRPWAHRTPNAMLVVDSVVQRDLLTGLDEDTTWAFHDACYDGVEKQFRGFGSVETTSLADATQEAGRTASTFDLGITDRYRAGLMLGQQVWTEGREVRATENTYGDCPLTGVPSNLSPAVRFICLAQVKSILKEGQPASEWTVLEENRVYDGYGNVTLDSNLGVTSVGGGGCAACTRDASAFGQACGAMCLGDEQFTETEFAAPDQPDSAWLLRLPTRARVYGRTGGEATETRTYYDGPDFVGLPLGQVTLGHPTRTSSRVSTESMDFIDVVRSRHDANGNPVEAVDANGNPTDHNLRRQWTYDSHGLHIIRTDHLLTDTQGQPYLLRREYQHDALFDDVTLATEWFVVKNGQELTPRNTRQWSYDTLGRMTGVVLPGGDTVASPTQSVTYDYGNPGSRVTVRQRSRVGQAADLEETSCYDGMGRIYQSRTRLNASTWQVNGFKVHNRQGELVRAYQAYTSTAAECDLAVPANVPFVEHTLDALGRTLTTRHPDAAERGGVASEIRNVYLPLATEEYDEEDVAGGALAPTVIRRNGLNRVVTVERRLNAVLPPVTHTVTYDEWGNLRGYIDPLGQERVQRHDLLGRVVSSTDSSRGTQTWTHDPHGNPTSLTDARGITQRFQYDGANRVRAQFQDGQETTTRIDFTYDLPPASCAAQDCSNTASQPTSVTYPLNGGRAMDLYGYTTRGEINLARRSFGNGATFEFRHTYDNAGRLLQTTYPQGITLPFGLDGAGRVTSVGNYIPSITYNARGASDTLTLQNGLRHAQTYDSRVQLAGLRVAPATGPAVVDLQYTRNRLGHVTRVQDNRAVAGEVSHNAAFTYDGLRRLTRAELDPGSAMLQEVLTFTHDTGDRLLSANSDVAASRQNVGAYTYDTARPYLASQVGTTAMTYDAAGNVTARGDLSLEWDHQGRLTRASRGAATVASFGYGAQDQRVYKSEGAHEAWYPSADYEVRDGVGTLWIRLADTRLAKVERAGWAPALYSDVAPVVRSGQTATAQPDGAISAADAWVAQASGSGVFTLAGNVAPSNVRSLLVASARALLLGTTDTVTFLHSDHLGTTVATTDSTGAVQEQIHRYPFGSARRTGPGAQEDRAFTGKEDDEATGLVNFGARYLDPVTGRWMSPDPGFEQLAEEHLGKLAEASSPYAYVGNNPTTLRDRDGRFWDFGPTGAIVGAVVAAALDVAVQRNRGEKVKWSGVLIAAAAGAVVGGFGGAFGIGVMVAARVIEIKAYNVADAHYQQKVANGSMSPEKAHAKARMWSKLIGTAASGLGGAAGLLSLARDGAVSALHIVKETLSFAGRAAMAKYGPRYMAWARKQQAEAMAMTMENSGAQTRRLSETVASGAPPKAKAAGRALSSAGRASMSSPSGPATPMVGRAGGFGGRALAAGRGR
jgi:RHS repeat-associated protein